MSPLTVVLPMLFVAVWAAFCAALLHHGCFDISAPFPEPLPTTPRAGYCDSVNSMKPWLSLTLGPTVLVAVLAFANRGNPRRVAVFTFVICLALIVNAAVANSLSYNFALR